MSSTGTRGAFIPMSGMTDQDGLYRPTIDEVERSLQSQWCGCGAKPGHGLRPMQDCGAAQQGCGAGMPRTMVMPGIGFGPHGFDTYLADSFPNICSEYPLMWNVADRDVSDDPMSLWGPPAPGTRDATDPWLPQNVRYQ